MSRRRGVVRVGPGPVPAGAGRSVSPSRISQQVAYTALNMSESTDLMRPTAVVARVDVSARRAPGKQDRRRQTGPANSSCCPSQVASKMQIYRRKSVEPNAATDAVQSLHLRGKELLEFSTDGRRRIYTLCMVPKKNLNGV